MPYLDSTAGNRTVQGVIAKACTFQAAGAAGVYTGSLTKPAGATLLNIIIDGIALWGAGTSAAMIVGDATDPNGYYDAINLKATDLLAGESIAFETAGGKAGAYIANSQVSPRYTAAEQTITGVVTTVGTTSAVGTTRMTIVYAFVDPSAVGAATYVAS